MPQEFHVLRCYQCDTFQVQQVKKSTKWGCKMCGEKQSIKKVYGSGSGADCRVHVQKLNLQRGELRENAENAQTEWVPECEVTDAKSESTCQSSAGGRWVQFMDTATPGGEGPHSDEDGEDGTATYTLDRKQFQAAGKRNKRYGRDEKNKPYSRTANPSTDKQKTTLSGHQGASGNTYHHSLQDQTYQRADRDSCTTSESRDHTYQRTGSASTPGNLDSGATLAKYEAGKASDANLINQSNDPGVTVPKMNSNTRVLSASNTFSSSAAPNVTQCQYYQNSDYHQQTTHISKPEIIPTHRILQPDAPILVPPPSQLRGTPHPGNWADPPGLVQSLSTGAPTGTTPSSVAPSSKWGRFMEAVPRVTEGNSSSDEEEDLYQLAS